VSIFLVYWVCVGWDSIASIATC